MIDYIAQVFLPRVAYAAAPPIPQTVKTFIGKISTEILNPVIAILFAIAIVYFFTGVAAYIWNPSDENLREAGRTRMIWGIVGMFIMVSVFAIMRLIIDTIGADQALMNYV